MRSLWVYLQLQLLQVIKPKVSKSSVWFLPRARSLMRNDQCGKKKTKAQSSPSKQSPAVLRWLVCGGLVRPKLDTHCVLDLASHHQPPENTRQQEELNPINPSTQ